MKTIPLTDREKQVIAKAFGEFQRVVAIVAELRGLTGRWQLTPAMDGILVPEE